MKLETLMLSAALPALAFAGNRELMSDAYWAIWNDAEQARIDADIEANRKADGAFDVGAPDGATVKVEIQAKKAARYVALPLTAVQHDGDKAFVWMVGEGNMPVRREVVPAATTATYEAIASGLEEGEEVIVSGTHKIMPGHEVEPVAL